MSRSLNIVITILFAVTCGLSQTSSDTAPTKWEKYALPGARASALLPKMPVVITHSYNCTGEKRSEYGAYSDGVAYVVTTVSKIDNSQYCPHPKKFDENSFPDRVMELEYSLTGAEVSDTEVNGQKLKRVRTKTAVYFLYNDFAHKRWFEFWAAGADESKAEVKNFLASLDLDEKSQGISIGDGSDRVLGEQDTTETPAVVTAPAEGPPASGRFATLSSDGARNGASPAAGVGSGSNTTGSEPIPVVKMDGAFKPLAIILRPLPGYTTSARDERVSGIVRLRVTFLNNGRIGPVTVVTGLPKGLNEQAIATAKKMLFVPAKKDGISISVTKTVEYNFSIY